jgi:hypothetical protein
MNDDVTQIKGALTGIWFLDAAGMQSQVALSPDGTYSNTLVGGASGHSGTWAVSNNAFGPGHIVVFTLTSSYPKEYVGPLGTVPITWPKSESWNVTSVQPEQILIQGGSLRRITPEMAAAGMSMGGVPPNGAGFTGMMTMTDYNAEVEKEMRQIADAGRKVGGALKNMWSAFKKKR